MALHLPRKILPLSSLKLSIADVKKIYGRLYRYVEDQATIELNALVKPADKTDADWQNEKKTLRDAAFRITVTIRGPSGEELIGDDESVFDSQSRPNKIAFIFMSNTNAYQNAAGRQPINAFELLLDFSQPPLLASTPVSAPTQNFSKLSVQGDRDAWVASICDAVLGVTNDRQTSRGWLHRAFVYDAGLVLFAVPFAVYECWRMSPFINRVISPVHSFVSVVAYVYIIGLVVWSYRVLFGYGKCAFPTVELVDNNDRAATHRTVLAAVLVGLAVDVIWQLLTT